MTDQPNRPRDPNKLAYEVVQELTGQKHIDVAGEYTDVGERTLQELLAEKDRIIAALRERLAGAWAGADSVPVEAITGDPWVAVDAIIEQAKWEWE